MPAPAGTGGKLRDLGGAWFRASSSYDLVALERLPDDVREQVGDLVDQAGLYGLLVPTRGGLAPKTACEDTALLLYTLAEPGPVPSYVRSKFGDETTEALAELVLDGVLEVADEEEGPFVGGIDACELLFEADEPPDAPETRSRLAGLTQEALRYGAHLRTANVGEVSVRMYGYNAEARTAPRRREFERAGGPLPFLGIGGAVRDTLNQRGWRIIDDTEDGWVFFSGLGPAVSPYKLYVSPRWEALPATGADVLDAVVSSRAVACKVGADVEGLLRPDKIVVYCESFEDLALLGDELERRLDGCPARGVPFTSQVDREGLLSWGMDPPTASQSAGLGHQESWRLWLTNRLAVSLAEAGRERAPAEAISFALERLRLDGVDTETWTPNHSIWRSG